MFPYTMLATTTVFYSFDWPKKFFLTKRILNEKQDENGEFYVSKLSSHCIYSKLNAEDSNEEEKPKKVTITINRINFDKF